MKVLEAQSAVLTNYEVYQHLTAMKERYAKERKNKRGPGNFQTIVMELMDYLEKPPSPLGSKPFPYDENTIYNLLERLRPYDLTKAEIIMIMDTRPASAAVLQNLIQEFDQRFEEIGSEEARQDILAIIADVLGAPDSSEREKIDAARDEAENLRQQDRDAPAVVNDDVEM